MALVELWDGWRGPDGEVVRAFAVICTVASATMAPITCRMPVILEPADWPAWLGEAEGDPAALPAQLGQPWQMCPARGRASSPPAAGGRPPGGHGADQVPASPARAGRAARKAAAGRGAGSG